MGRGEGDVCGDRYMARRGKEEGPRIGEIHSVPARLRPGLLRGVCHSQHLLQRLQGLDSVYFQIRNMLLVGTTVFSAQQMDIVCLNGDKLCKRLTFRLSCSI